MTMKHALTISAIVHVMILAPLYGLSYAKDDAKDRKTMVVDYIVEKKPIEIKTEKPSNLDTHKTVSLKQTAVKTEDAKPSKSAIQPKAPPVKAADKETSKKKAILQEAAVKNSKDYINYYQLIREKIKQKLKENYKYHYGEGEVYLVFVLEPDGSLYSYSVDASKSARDETLKNIAVASLVEAAPFQPFPKELPQKRLAFNLAVSFNKK